MINSHFSQFTNKPQLNPNITFNLITYMNLNIQTYTITWQVFRTWFEE